MIQPSAPCRQSDFVRVADILPCLPFVHRLLAVVATNKDEHGKCAKGLIRLAGNIVREEPEISDLSVCAYQVSAGCRYL